VDVDGADLAADTEFDVVVSSTDAAGNTVETTATSTHSVDEAAPTLEISSTKSTLASGEEAEITFTFSEEVQGFDLSSAGVTGGSLADLSARTVNNDGTVSYTAALTADGSGPISITVDDGSFIDLAGNEGVGDDQSINSAPVAENDSASANEDKSITGNVLGNDSDKDGDNLTVTGFEVGNSSYAAGDSVGLAEGTFKLEENGDYIFEPTADWSGSVPEVGYTVQDGNGGQATGKLDLSITAVADKPDLNLSVSQGVPVLNEFYRSDLDSETATDGFVDEVDGWIPGPGAEAIELRDETYGTDAAVGSQYIELNNSTTFKNAPSIQRSVQTENDAQYTLDFQYSPRPGFDESINVFEVVVDGEVVGTFSEDGSSLNEASWRSGSVTFEGDGTEQTIVLREASDNDQPDGRGIFIDDLALSKTSYSYDVAIDSSLVDTDGSESLALVVNDLPVGSELTDGNGHAFKAEAGDTSIDVTDWDISALSLTVPSEVSDSATLTVEAISTEQSNSDSATTTQTVDLTPATPSTEQTLVLTNYDGEAGYNNSLGYYVKNEDGTPKDGKVIWANSSNANQGDVFELTGYAESEVGFFIIPNGGTLNNNLSDETDVTFSKNDDGEWQVEAGNTVLSGQQAPAFFDQPGLNPDGENYVEDNADAVGDLNWEDQVNGDNSFDDVNADASWNSVIVTGTGGEDRLEGVSANDILTGGAGNDILTGGLGADTFRWELGDQGSQITPAQDTVTDFTKGNVTSNSEADRLDFADLLQGEEDEASLEGYIMAEEDGSNTTLYLNSDGDLGGNKANADQIVTLQNVSMDGESSQDFIQELMNNNQLNIDT
ncbi:Ig-like domain-containing protein, partial [Salicola sp. Rm-C-2C1-2]|uniref:Ig-like domain-containing protein n=1 Tax=Salicola sp. Rm-C-2C1-2 TaxID=3141321 RepID=UPI0032E41DEB